MEQKWDGKSQGNKLGYAIFIKLIKLGGRKPAYFLLQFVAQYYIWFVPKATGPMRDLYANKLGYTKRKVNKMIRRNIISFGQSLIDKMYVMVQQSDHGFVVDHSGEKHIWDMANSGKGGILLSAHLGNWEMSGSLLTRYKHVYNIVLYEGEDKSIREYLNKEGAERRFNIIYIKDDMSHIYEMSAALNRNEFICMHADRFVDGNRTIKAPFLGYEAQFPLGPFVLASKLRAPVSFVFALKDDSDHYSFYATPAQTFEGRGMEGAQKMLEAYILEVTDKLKKYPDQWFNYFDFWA
jgi:predicted LPLAT superfamily acyltransferase